MFFGKLCFFDINKKPLPRKELFFYSFSDEGAAVKGEPLGAGGIEIAGEGGRKLGEAAGDTVTDCIKTYAMKKLNKASDATLITLLVDILNYGAAAQTYFGYATDNLANSELTADQQAYATAKREYSDEVYNKYVADGYSFRVMGTLTLESNIQIKLGFDLSNVALSENAKIVVSYVAAKTGETITKVVNLSEVNTNEVVYVTCDTLTARDHNQAVTYEIIDGETTIFSYTTSVECFVARLAAGNEKVSICEALMKYCDSAEAYFKK